MGNLEETWSYEPRHTSLRLCIAIATAYTRAASQALSGRRHNKHMQGILSSARHRDDAQLQHSYSISKYDMCVHYAGRTCMTTKYL